MKRKGNLTEQIASLDNLYLAYTKAKRRKACKKEVLLFAEKFDANIQKLRTDILNGHADVGHYHYFKIYDPKERIICAASFSERVLHHAIMNVCHDTFDRNLIADTYATRKGKGVYAALDKAKSALAKYKYAVKLDFRKYYDSISHDVLKEKLCRKFKDKKLLCMLYQIIDSYHTTPQHGLPIGNLTSQYLANFYLSELDHKCKEEWHICTYIRYMDDILLADNDKAKLKDCVRHMKEYSTQQLELTLKPPIFARSTNGLNFLGYKTMPQTLLLAGRSKRRFRSKLIQYNHLLEQGKWTPHTYVDHIQPLIAFTMHATSRDFRTSCLEITKGVSREWV